MLRLFGFLFLLVLVVLGVGLLQGWWSFSTVEAGGKTGVSFSVDKDKIAQDTSALKEKAGEALDKLKSTTVSGTVAVVDAAASKLTVKIGEQERAFDVPAGLGLTLDGAPVELLGLAAGDQVTLTLDKAGAITKLAASRK